VSKALRILLGLLSLGLFIGALFAFVDLQSNERVTLVAIRQACAAAGAGASSVQILVADHDPSASLVSDAAAAGLTLVPLTNQTSGPSVRLVVSGVRSTGMFSSVVSIRRLGEGTDAGVETDYQLAWSLGWAVVSQDAHR